MTTPPADGPGGTTSVPEAQPTCYRHSDRENETRQSRQGETPTRDNEQHAASWWNEWFNLRGTGGIVHQKERALAFQHGKVESA